MKTTGNLLAGFLIFYLAIGARPVDAAVELEDIADQRAQPGSLYSYTPEVQSDRPLLWRKSYGPDELIVDPFSGNVRWSIPEEYLQQSLHVGIVASDGMNLYEITWVLTVGDGKVAYMDVSDNLGRALGKMKSGGTLIIRNGTVDSSNRSSRIDTKKRIEPPRGSAGAMTTVIAEDPGRVILDVDGADAFGIHLIETSHIKLAGFVIKNAGRIGLRLFQTKFIYIKDIGIEDSGRASNSYNHNVSNLNIIASSDFLVEGLYSWGHSRYKVQVTESQRGIIRRSVVRLDHYSGSNPVGGFQSYCSKDIVYENNIVIDSDTSEFWPRFKNHQNAFGVPATGCYDVPVGNRFIGSIVLNSDIGAMQTDAKYAEGPTIWSDIVAWDITLDRYKMGEGHPTPLMHAVGRSLTRFLTAGEVSIKRPISGTGVRYFYSRSAPSVIRASILTNFAPQGDLTWANDPSLSLEDSIIHGFEGTISGGDETTALRNFDIDPQLRYLPRAPRDLAAKCGGRRCGATVMHMTGPAGTFWGDASHLDPTTMPAWPVAAEHTMAEHMRGYRFEGRTRGDGTGQLSGDRGFAKRETDLTHYIWGYLGQPVPPMQVYARENDGVIDVSWLPVRTGAIREYRVYEVVNDQQRRVGVVEHKNTVVSLKLDVASHAGPFRVTSVTDDGVESEEGYNVELID